MCRERQVRFALEDKGRQFSEAPGWTVALGLEMIFFLEVGGPNIGRWGPLSVLAGKVGSLLISPPSQSLSPEHKLQKCNAIQQLLDVYEEPGARFANRLQSRPWKVSHSGLRGDRPINNCRVSHPLKNFSTMMFVAVLLIIANI